MADVADPRTKNIPLADTPSQLPPTDKALAVMTPTHIAVLSNALEEGIEGVVIDWRLRKSLREIREAVRYLVDHPERLAGEDEVVVKRKEVGDV